ncbi:MAG TPA: hypothetical protein VM422_09645, partial [Amaricoccus sp.]|nr:hypothetical protein [Amaricoccus sp.]
MAAGSTDRPEGPVGGLEGESLAEVLASIRALVSAETEARAAGPGQADTVLMLTPDMRAGAQRPAGPGAHLADGNEGGPAAPAPAHDEQALREMINAIVREDLGDLATDQLAEVAADAVAELALQLLAHDAVDHLAERLLVERRRRRRRPA